MERTNEELKDELLKVYRYTFGLYEGLHRAKLTNSRLKREAERAKEQQADAEEQLKIFKADFDDMVDEHFDMAHKVFVQSLAMDAALDLVGAVIEQEAVMDHHWKLLDFVNDVDMVPANTEMSYPAVPGPVPGMAAKDEKARPPEPTLCLSCGEGKGFNFYLCDTCFELSADLEVDIFSELSSAWDKGARDFPRPGKNARTIQVSESEGER